MTVIIFVALLTFLILVHELGHFWSARRAGIRVEEFGLGLPPRLIGVQRDAGTGKLQLVPGFWSKRKPGPTTVYSFNLLPIGGFIRIFGEDGTDSRDPRSFANQTWSVRSRTILAGVAMNLVLAIVLATIGFSVGLPAAVDEVKPGETLTDIRVRIVGIASDAPAKRAGLKVGDAIVRIEHGAERLDVSDISEVQAFAKRFAGSPVTVIVERGATREVLSLVPRVNPPPGEGAVGIAMLTTGLRKLPFFAAVREGIGTTFGLAWFFLQALGDVIMRFFIAGEAPTGLAGPIGIQRIVSDASALGWRYVLNLAILLSINLAVLNFLPFPALDGGRFLFLLVEKLKGSPVSRRIEQFAHSVGMALLLLAIIAISVQDIRRFF